MSISDLIATAALIVAIVAAVFAGRSVAVARRGNEIALHRTRKGIYDGLLKYRSMFVAFDLHPDDDAIDWFFREVVAPAQLYLPRRLAARIHDLYNQSCQQYERICAAENAEPGAGSKWDQINAFQALGSTTLEELIDDVRNAIQLSNA